MTARYAIIGWGSLIWDLEILTPHVTGDWLMGKGPLLAMEFTRVSPKRKMGLAVCLDPEHGAPCSTHVITSARDTLQPAIADLAARERAPLDRIGGVCLATGATHGRAEIAAVVRDWCQAHNWHGAVWTDLLTNYPEMRGEAFSISRAMAYLKTLTGESLDEAVRYIDNAPAQTDTPLRRALAGDPWWQAEAVRVRALDALQQPSASG